MSKRVNMNKVHRNDNKRFIIPKLMFLFMQLTIWFSFIALSHPVEQLLYFIRLWRGTYQFEQILSDMTYEIPEFSADKQLIVHYDRLKPCRLPPAEFADLSTNALENTDTSTNWLSHKLLPTTNVAR